MQLYPPILQPVQDERKVVAGNPGAFPSSFNQVQDERIVVAAIPGYPPSPPLSFPAANGYNLLPNPETYP